MISAFDLDADPFAFHPGGRWERILGACVAADRWAGQIAQMLDGSGTTFVAVGALHLAGDHSVQDFLRQGGFAAVRVQ